VWRQAATATLLKVVLLPLFGWRLLVELGAPPAETAIGVLLLATPTAISSYPVAAELGGDTDLAGACILLTTVVSFVAFAAWSLLLGL
jgi:predicted permease